MTTNGSSPAPIPAGYDNSHDPVPISNQQSTILGVVLAGMVLSWTCILLRLYTRYHISHAPGWDDLFIGLYLIPTTMGSVCICILTYYGLGQHFLTIPPDTMRTFRQIFYVGNASYPLSASLIKVSLLLQYIRIFEGEPVVRRFCVWTVAITLLWGAVYGFMAWFPCFPVSGFWDMAANAKCYGYGSMSESTLTAVYESHTVVNMLLDLIILAIPMQLFFKKGQTANVRTRLVVLLILGCLVNLFSIWRLVSMVQCQAGFYPTFDPTWYTPAGLLLAAVEIDAASICASVPVFWPSLSSRLGSIFVTKEVTVTYQDRQRLGDGSLSRCRSGSEVSLSGINRNKTHYDDPFVVAHVTQMDARDQYSIACASSQPTSSEGQRRQ